MTTLLLAGSLVTGLGAGVIAGMLGVGGGLVIVPVLLYLFHLDGIHPGISMQLAVGTSLATIVVTNLTATWGHHRHRSVRWTLVRIYTPGILLGAWFGSHLAVWLKGEDLRLLFGIFEILMGLRMALPSPPRVPPKEREVPSLLSAVLAMSVGGLSSMFGIGGGTLSVPLFTMLHRVPIREAVGASSAIGIVIALAGVSGFIHAGWSTPGLPPDSIGFILPSAFAGIAVGTLFTTHLGVRLAHTMPPEKLRRLFGFFLVVVGVKLMW